MTYHRGTVTKLHIRPLALFCLVLCPFYTSVLHLVRSWWLPSSLVVLPQLPVRSYCRPRCNYPASVHSPLYSWFRNSTGDRIRWNTASRPTSLKRRLLAAKCRPGQLHFLRRLALPRSVTFFRLRIDGRKYCWNDSLRTGVTMRW